jgi:hypothetical protein
MGAAAIPLMVASTTLSAVGQIQQGKQAQKMADYKADQLEQQAGQTRAVAQRKSSALRRQAALAESRTLAVAAASGAGAADKTVMDIMSGIYEQGELNAQAAIYEGEERARGMEMSAAGARIEGKQAKRAGYIGAAGTIMGSAAQGLTAKYSPTGGMASGGMDIGFSPTGSEAGWY